MENVSQGLNSIVNGMKDFQKGEVETKQGKMTATSVWSWITGAICVVLTVIWVYDEYQKLPTPIPPDAAANLFKRFIEKIATCVA